MPPFGYVNVPDNRDTGTGFDTPQATGDWRSRAVAIETPETTASWRSRAEPVANPANLEIPEHSNAPPDLVNYLAPAGIPTDMLDMGVTPGNAAKWADLHIQKAEQELGTRLDPGRQQAIFDIYKQAAGRQDLSSRNYTAEQRQQRLAERPETLGGRVMDASAGFARNFATTGTSLIGTVAPETAEDLQQDIDAQYATDPDSRAAWWGGLAAEAVKLGTVGRAGALTGRPALTMASFYGGQGFGGSRQQAEQLRRGGTEVSLGQELGTAAGVGGVEALSGAVGARIFGAMGKQLNRLGGLLSGATREAGQRGLQAAVRQGVSAAAQAGGLAFAEGAEEAATQVVTNKITQLGMDPKQAVLEGLGESFAMGVLLSPIGAGSVQAPRRIPGSDPVDPMVDDMIRETPQTVEDETGTLALPPGRAETRFEVDPEGQTRDLTGTLGLPAGQTPPGGERFTVDPEGVARDRTGTPGLPAAPTPSRFVGQEEGPLEDTQNPLEPVPTGRERFEGRFPEQAPQPAAETAPAAEDVPSSPLLGRTEEGAMILQDRDVAEAMVQREYQERLNDEEVQALIEQGMSEEQAIETTFGSIPSVEEGSGVLADTYTVNFQPGERTPEGRQFTTEGIPATPEERIAPEARELRDAVQQVIGEDTEVRIVDDLPGARGFYDADTGTMYVRNDENQAGMFEALVHESMHASGLDVASEIGSPRIRKQLARDYLQNFEEFARRNPDSPQVQSYIEKLRNDPAMQEREAVATLGGRLATDPTFAAQLSKRSPTFVQKVVNAIRRAINTVTGKQKDIDRLAREMLAKIEENTGLRGTPGFQPEGEVELQNSWISPEGRVVPTPIRQHSAVAEEQLRKMGQDPSGMDTDEMFNALMEEGWVRVQSAHGGRRGGWNVAARKITPEARDTLTLMSDQAIGTDKGISIIHPRSQGLTPITAENQSQILRSIETKLADDDDIFEGMEGYLPDRPMARTRVESLQREIAELRGKLSRATSEGAKADIEQTMQKRREAIEEIQRREDRPKLRGMFLPETADKTKAKPKIDRMASVGTLTKMAEAGVEGRHWYRTAKKAVAESARQLGVDTKEFAEVLALFSPRVSVRRNIRMAIHYFRAREAGLTGDERFPHDSMRGVRSSVRHWEKTGEIRGPKTGPFARAIAGDADAVVLDVWMARAFGVDQKRFSNTPVRERAQGRIRKAAEQLGWTPAETQAAVWTTAVKQAGRNPGQFHIASEFPATDHANVVARQYMDDAGIEPGLPSSTEAIDQSEARRVADAYHNLQHNPDHPAVKKSYDAFKQETMAQFQALQDSGWKFELEGLEQVAERYPTAEKMIAEVNETRTLYTADDPGDMPSDHPLMEDAPGMPGWTYNQVFRAVHDIMGHVRAGVGFDILGEENAWRSHAQMYTPLAKGALATETRGQSNWVGYGPEGPGNQQAIADNDIGRVKFPPQKAGLMSAEFHTPKTPEQPGFLPDDMKKPGIRPSSGRFTLPQGLEDFIAPISTRLRNISPVLYKRLQRFELRSRVQREDLQRVVGDFLQKKNKALSKEQQRQFTLLTANGKFDEATELLRSVDPSLVRGFSDARNVLNSVYAAAKRAGIDVGFRENYWPREVRDYKEWRQQVRGDEPGDIRDAIKAAEDRRGRELNASEEIEIVNRILQGYGPRKPGDTNPKAFRNRTQEEITEDMLDLYHDSDHAIMGYINRATHSIEKARFFGKGEVGEDILDSIGRYTAELVSNNEITADEERTVKNLLASRFTSGEASPNVGIRTLRDAGYLTVLANPISAVTQLGDLFLAGYRSGTIPALKALARRKRVKMESLGIERIAAEFANPGKMAKALDTAMRASGFTRIDRLGKETLLNAALNKYERAARNPKSRQARQFRRDYETVFGSEFESVMDDLANDRITENVRLLLFMELAGIQPISLSEMPKKYLDAPNGRIFYMLKTFTIKQLDLLRRNSFAKMNRGEVQEGATDLLRYAMIFGIGNAGADILKDWLLGRDVKWTDLAIDGVLRLFGGNKFLLDSAAKDGPGEAFFNMLMPPTNVLDDAVRDVSEIPDIWSGEEGVSSIRNIPLFGKVLYWRAGEGGQRAEEKRKTEDRRRLREIRDIAIAALDQQDRTSAKAIINKWNTEERPEWMEEITLRSVITSRRSRISSAFSRAKESAAEALLQGDREQARKLIEEHNANDPPRKLTIRHAEVDARRMRARGKTE